MLFNIKAIEKQADKLISEKSGIAGFSGVYNWHWHNGIIAGAYVSAIVETAQGLFYVQFWKRRGIVQLHTESQPGIFTPICSATI